MARSESDGSTNSVVPAEAGTHNHRRLLLKQSRPPSCPYNFRRGVWVPAFAGTTWGESVRPHSRGAFRPRFYKFVGPLENRGRRESRVPTAPAVSCAKRTVIGAHEHTGSAETARLSPRNGFTAYFVLSPVSGLCCHRHLAKNFPTRLSASVAAPGPHDFAVRAACVRLSQAFASTASHRAFRDDREPPLSSGETHGPKH